MQSDKTPDNTVYYGKKFSIMGDSISTLDGFNPPGYRVYYSGRKCRKSRVRTVSDTWWGGVIDFFDGTLLVNNSWSGSRVTKEPARETVFPSGCSDERTNGLHRGSDLPDVIIIFLGANDWEQGVTIDSSYDTKKSSWIEETFEDAYKIMLDKLKHNYPNAEIWCCTLGKSFISRKKKYKFPYIYAGVHIDEYNKIIRQAANSKGCHIIDFAKSDIAYDSVDGSHPTYDGMRTLTELVISEINKFYNI